MEYELANLIYSPVLERSVARKTLDSEGQTKTNSVAFDNEKYLEEQTGAIVERIERFDNKLYLESI